MQVNYFENRYYFLPHYFQISKFKSPSYSRFARSERRIFGSSIENIAKITDYNFIASNVDNLMERVTEHTSMGEPKESDTSWLLKQLMESSEKNSKGNNGNRYDEDLMDTSAFVYILCGKAAYKFLYMNLPIPCEKSVQNRIQKKFDRYIEGNIFFKK
jgi:hypothetical protein